MKIIVALILLSSCTLYSLDLQNPTENTSVGDLILKQQHLDNKRFIDGKPQWNEWDIQFILDLAETVEGELTSTYDDHFLLYESSMILPLYKQFWYKNLIGKDLSIKRYTDVTLSNTDEIIAYEYSGEESLSVKNDGLYGSYNSDPAYGAGWDQNGYLEYYELTGCYRHEYSYNGDQLSKQTYYRIDTVTLEKIMDGYREYYYKDSKPSYRYYFYEDSLGKIIKDDSTAYITAGDTTYVTKFNIIKTPIVPEGRHRLTEKNGKLTSHLYQRYNTKTEKWETPYELETYHFNEKGLCTSIIDYKGPDTLCPPISRVDFDYNNDGNRLKSTYFKYENDQWVLKSSSTVEYNQDGNITKFPFYGDIYEIQYKNNLPCTIIGSKEVDSTGKIHAKYVKYITFSSNEDDGVIVSSHHSSNEVVSYSSNILSIEALTESSTLSVYNLKGQLVARVSPKIAKGNTVYNLNLYNLASSVYTLKLESQKYHLNKFVYLKQKFLLQSFLMGGKE